MPTPRIRTSPKEPGLPELAVMVTPATFPCKASDALRRGSAEISSPFICDMAPVKSLFLKEP